MKPKELQLCGTCLALYKESYKCTKVAGGVDNKITCDHCKKRRYGGTYAIERKGK